MDAVDRIEALLELGATELEPEAAAAIGEDPLAACELAARRWSVWQESGQDLFDGLAAPPLFSRLAARRTGVPFLDLGGDTGGGAGPVSLGAARLCEVPRDAAGWEPGAPILLFQEELKDALIRGGAPTSFGYSVAGALQEMTSNASEHAGAPVAPVACYSVAAGRWGFVVVDVGCGVRASLHRNPDFADVKTELEALQAALQPGVSSTGEVGRGYGFRSLFKALVDRQCSLRLRSGEALAVWSGTSPTHQTMRWRVCPALSGFQMRVSGEF